MNVNKLTLSDHRYPKVLNHIPDPPAQIYYAGQEPDSWLNRPRVAIVGSRKFSTYGKSIAAKFAYELAQTGVVIISGLAFGIDITAHKAALEAGGITVAVLGTGLDSIYPAAHYHIAEQIIENGSLISEYPSGTPGYPVNFIARNRLISALAEAVIIPEAALKSGSLHTARFAMEQGKTVMAVPGNITSPASEGCNNLIKSGAVPVTSTDDIFFALKISPDSQRQKSFRGTELEEKIYSLIRDGISDQEELVAAARIDSPTLSSTLTMLEISGYIRPVGAGGWVIS
jgi:DNA processing protein